MEKRLYNVFWTENATYFIEQILESFLQSSTKESKNCNPLTAGIIFNI